MITGHQVLVDRFFEEMLRSNDLDFAGVYLCLLNYAFDTAKMVSVTVG